MQIKEYLHFLLMLIPTLLLLGAVAVTVALPTASDDAVRPASVHDQAKPANSN